MTKKVAARKAISERTLQEYWSKKDERNRATIAKAKTCHMSNAKWRKLLGVLPDLGVCELRWKFVRSEQIYTSGLPWPDAVLEDRLGEIAPYPYGPYRDIDWIEVPQEQAVGLVDALAGVGQFPLVQTKSGVRIVGYSW